MRDKRFRILVTVIGLFCGLLWLAGVMRWQGNRASAQQAAEDLAACRRLAEELEELRGAPQTVRLEQQTQQQITLSIQRAAQIAEIADSNILRITPQAGRRLRDSPHLQQPVDVEIRSLTLGQLTRFLNELGALDEGLKPTSLRLTAPRSQPSDTKNEMWGCEFVLTYLVFSPE